VLLLAPAHAGAKQLRGVGMTPNWAAAAPYTVTAEQQQAEVDSVCAMGGDLTRFWVSESDLSSDYEVRVDQVMARAAACRIRVIMNVYDAHAVAPVQGRFLLDVAHLLSRYPGLYALEVWNEPNNPPFFSGTPGQYAALVNEAVEAKRLVGSATKILAGVTAGGDRDYLNQLYAAGMRGHDGVSIHPYSWGNPARRDSPYQVGTELVHKAMLKHGDSSGLYLTEFGFASCPATPTCVSDRTQARWLAASFRVARGWRYVRGLTAFTVRDVGSSNLWDHRMGVLTAGFQRRQAWWALRRALSRGP
jgi:hypothetical protein